MRGKRAKLLRRRVRIQTAGKTVWRAYLRRALRNDKQELVGYVTELAKICGRAVYQSLKRRPLTHGH